MSHEFNSFDESIHESASILLDALAAHVDKLGGPTITIHHRDAAIRIIGRCLVVVGDTVATHTRRTIGEHFYN